MIAVAAIGINPIGPISFGSLRLSPLSVVRYIGEVIKFSVVPGRVFAAGFKKKVLNPVVKGIAIQMMDDLVTRKGTPDMGLHYDAMGKHFFPIMHNKVASIMYPPFCAFSRLSNLSKPSLFNGFWSLFVTFMRHIEHLLLFEIIPPYSGFVNYIICRRF